MSGGFFGIGILNGKTPENVGTLWRGAYQLGADFIFTVSRRYSPQHSDTYKTWRHVPLWRFASVAQLRNVLPRECLLIGVEEGGTDLPSFSHPERCAYLLGAEDHGLTDEARAACHSVVTIPAIRQQSYNVAQAGTLVMYDREVGS